VSYSEVPWAPGGQFSVSVVRDDGDGFRLIKKSWDSAYDLHRFSSRVFNLDRLCIRTGERMLSAAEARELQAILNGIETFPDSLEEPAWIVLDGVDYALKIVRPEKEITYTWKTAGPDIVHFRPLLDFLRTAYER
jgi:hypothetical protein